MSNPQRTSHLLFALLMAAILVPPIFGLLAQPAAGQKPAPAHATLSEQQRDLWNSGVVTGALQFNSHLRPFNIHARAQGQSVLLQGTVTAETERELAKQIALSVAGIEKVTNDIRVDTTDTHSLPDAEANISDAAVNTKVKSQLLANRITSGLDIDVNTREQVVTLAGAVTSPVERELVYYITRNTRGVRDVINQVEVMLENAPPAF